MKKTPYKICSNKTQNNFFLQKYKTGNVYLYLEKMAEHSNNDTKIIRIEIYDKINKDKRLYDIDFHTIENRKKKIDNDFKNTVSSLWNSAIQFEHFYPLYIRLYPEQYERLSVFITYFTENDFSTREEISSQTLYYVF